MIFTYKKLLIFCFLSLIFSCGNFVKKDQSEAQPTNKEPAAGSRYDKKTSPHTQIVPKGLGGFVEGTIVYTATGPDVIQGIRINDKLLSFSSETGLIVARQVIDVHMLQIESVIKIMINGEKLYLHPEHLFYVPLKKEWLAAKNLKPGICVFSDVGSSCLQVETIDRIGGNTLVYNIELENNSGYFVGKTKILGVSSIESPSVAIWQ